MFKNSSAKYYQKNKETFQKTLVKGIDLSVENENKKNQHGRERYSNFPEDEKQRLIEYRKKKDKL